MSKVKAEPKCKTCGGDKTINKPDIIDSSGVRHIGEFVDCPDCPQPVSVTEHPDVQRLIAKVVTLQAQIKDLEQPIDAEEFTKKGEYQTRILAQTKTIAKQQVVIDRQAEEIREHKEALKHLKKKAEFDMPVVMRGRFHNACTDPCDMIDGPCACGAWHSAREWVEKLVEREARLQTEIKQLEFASARDRNLAEAELAKGNYEQLQAEVRQLKRLRPSEIRPDKGQLNKLQAENNRPKGAKDGT